MNLSYIADMVNGVNLGWGGMLIPMVIVFLSAAAVGGKQPKKVLGAFLPVAMTWQALGLHTSTIIVTIVGVGCLIASIMTKPLYDILVEPIKLMTPNRRTERAYSNLEWETRRKAIDTTRLGKEIEQFNIKTASIPNVGNALIGGYKPSKKALKAMKKLQEEMMPDGVYIQ